MGKVKYGPGVPKSYYTPPAPKGPSTGTPKPKTDREKALEAFDPVSDSPTKIKQGVVEPTRPEVTKSKIIIDDVTGKQVASIQQRGKTEVDITRVSSAGLRTTQTIRGTPGYVSQEVARVERYEYPRTVSKPTPSIQQAVKQAQRQQLEKVAPDIYVPPEARVQLRRIDQGQTSKPPEQLTKNGKEWFVRLQDRSLQIGVPSDIKQKAKQTYRTITDKEYREKLRQQEQQTRVQFKRTEQYQQYLDQPWYMKAFKGKPKVEGEIELAVPLIAAPGAAARGAVTQAKRFSDFIYGTGRFRTAVGTTQKVATGITTAAGTQKTVRGVGEATTIDKDTRELLKQRDADISGIVARSLEAETQATLGGLVPGEGLRRYASVGGAKALGREWLPFGTVVIGDKEAFKKQAMQEYMALGYSESEAKKLVKVTAKQRYVRAAAEASGQLGVERASESVGRFLVTKQFAKKAGQELPKSGFRLGGAIGTRIGAAGVLEGTGGEYLSAQARGEEITARRLGIGAVAGAGIGGGLGGFIGQRFARKGAQDVQARFVNAAANIADIYEKPGDILQDITERTGARLLGRRVSEPRVRQFKGVRTFDVAPPTKTPTFSSFFARSMGQTPATVKKAKGTKPYTFDDVLAGKVPTQIEGLTSVPPKDDVITKIDVPIDTIGKQPVWVPLDDRGVPIPEEQKIITPTQTGFPTFTPIPTVVPGRAVIGAPIPLGGAPGQAMRGTKATTVYNELQRNVNRFFGGVQKQMQQPVRKKSRKKKKPSKRNYTKVKRSKKRK